MRCPYFKSVLQNRTSAKIQNIKDNVVKRIKLLVEKCDQRIGRDRTIKALEKPDKNGNSLAFVVLRDFTEDLFDWLVKLDIQVNALSMGILMTPFFREQRVVEYLLKKGVTPYIHYEDDSRLGQAITWRCQKDDFRHNFETMGEDALSDESQKILDNLIKEQSLCKCQNCQCSKPKVRHAVCFSPFDLPPYFKAGFTEIKNMVPFNCLDARIYGNMYDFFYHDTSMIFKTKWNGQDAVMKCRKYIPKYHQNVLEAYRSLTKRIYEFDDARGSSNENMGFWPLYVPLAYFRQQYMHYEANDNELDEKFQQPPNSYQAKKYKFKSSSKVLNIDVLVWPRYDGNLRQLKTLKQDRLTAEELRKGLVKIFTQISRNLTKSSK